MRYRPLVSMVTLLTLIMSQFACATLFKGTREEVTFNSRPQGAKVILDGVDVGETPLTLKLESKRTYHITFRFQNGVEKSFQLTKHTQGGWIVLDVLAGLVPVIVDAATGAWYKLDTTNVNVSLKD